MPLHNGDKIIVDYEHLLQEVEQIRQKNVGLEAVQNISNAMDVAEKLVEGVSKPREIGLDARVFELSSVVVQQNAEKLDSVFRTFDFGDKLVGALASNRYEGSQSEAGVWKGLSEHFSRLLRVRPVFDYLCGTYDREGFKPKERAQRASQKRRDLAKDMVKALPEKGLHKEDISMGQQEILDRISKLLRKLYKENGNNSISYFQFILNPDSFEETCQNVLNVAFLVRDSFVKMTMEGDELMMTPCKQKRDDMGGIQKEESKRQIVIQMEKQDWRDLVAVYDVREPAIDFGLASQHKAPKNK